MNPPAVQRTLLFFLMILAFPWSSRAETRFFHKGTPIKDINAMNQLSLEELLNVTISTTLTAHPAETAPANITVITAEQIRALGLRTLAEALQLVPCLTVLDTQFNSKVVAARGVATSANIRVSLDGQPLNDFYDGWFPAQLRLNNIERIEVICGPGSALYGTNAFAAVISLFTLPVTEGTHQLGLQVHAGALVDDAAGYLFQGHSRYAMERRGWELRLAGAFDRSSGPRVTVERDAIASQRYTEVPGKTEGLYQSGSFQLSAARRGLLGGKDRLELSSLLRYRDKGPYFGPSTVFTRQTELNRLTSTSYLEYQRPLGQVAELKARLFFNSHHIDETIHLQPDGYVFVEGDGNQIVFEDGKVRRRRYTSNSGGLLSYLIYRLPQLSFIRSHDLIAGLTAEHSWLPDFHFTQNYAQDAPRDGFANFDGLPLEQNGKSRFMLALFGQYQLQPTEWLWLTGGIRFDHYSDFGATFNPRAAVVLKPHAALAFKLLYGRAFRAPTFEELYDSTSVTGTGERILPNPDLAPETTHTAEVGGEWSPFKQLALQANGFFIETDDAIDINMVFNLAGTQRINYPGLRVMGAEAGVRLAYSEKSYLQGNFAWLSAEQLGEGIGDLANDSQGKILDRSMTHLPTLRANVFFVANPLWTLWVSGRYSYIGYSENNKRFSYEKVARAFERPAFHELSLRTSLYPLGPRWEVGVILSKSISKQIPITLSETDIYQLPAGSLTLLATLSATLGTTRE